jgi:hypothetical protein
MIPDMHKSRQQTQQDACVLCTKGKKSCETQARPAALPRNNASIQRLSHDRPDIDRRDR